MIITLLWLLGHLISLSFAQQHWTLIDDEDPAITYGGIWQVGPCGDSCLYPNLTNVYNETWHVTWPSRSTGDSSFKVQFRGFGALISAIVDDKDPDVTMQYAVTLDGVTVNNYYASANTGEIHTNSIVFFRQDLEDTVHTLSVDISAMSFFALDYVGWMDTDANGNVAGPMPPVSTSSSSSPSSGRGTSTSGTTTETSRTSTTTSFTMVTGPSGTTSIPITDTISRGGTSIDPATVTLPNILVQTQDMSTSLDSSGHTFLVPVSDAGEDPHPTYSHGSTSPTGVSYTSTTFSPALAGAIGAAVAAMAAVLIVLFIFCLRKRKEKRRRLRPSDAEPYILANSTTPSTVPSSLSPPLSPMPYSPQSVLGLFVGPQAIPDRPQLDLLSSPPPNTLSSPISPNQPYPYPVTHKIISSSNARGLTPRRQSDMAELRSPITPLTIQRPNDWDIEGAVVHNQTPTSLTVPSSPMVPTPSPRTSRRRSGRSKEPIIDEAPPPPLPNIPMIREPSLPRRRRVTNPYREMLPNVMPGQGNEGLGVQSDEESLPVNRRQSFSHPAPPAYSPPRLVRNADMRDLPDD